MKKGKKNLRQKIPPACDSETIFGDLELDPDRDAADIRSAG
jgi:hypothetical protein